MWRPFLLALALCGWAATAPADSRLSLDEGRQMVAERLRAGDPAGAQALAMALLQANPRDAAMLVIVSQTERAQGNLARARHAGTAAWAYAETGPEKYAAAVVTAQALVSEKKYSRAQLWLRRASNHAPNPQAAAILAQDFARVRALNPLGLNLSVNASPSSNVNNGSARATTTFEGLPFVFTLSPEARALSGVEATAQLGLRYRLAQGETWATFAEAELFARQVLLSSKARAEAPDAENGDYGYAQAGIGLSHRWRPKGARGGWSLGFSLGQSRYGGDPYTRFAILRLGRDWDMGKAGTLAVTFNLEDTRYVSPAETTLARRLGLRWTRPLANGDRLTASLGLNDTTSSRSTREFDGVTAGLTWDLGQISRGLDLAIDYEIDMRLFPVAGLETGARHDQRHTLRADLGLRRAEIYGFVPVVSVEASRNASTLDYYDSTTLRMGLNLRSRF